MGIEPTSEAWEAQRKRHRLTIFDFQLQLITLRNCEALHRLKWHFLYFFPYPHHQGAFLRIFVAIAAFRPIYSWDVSIASSPTIDSDP